MKVLKRTVQSLIVGRLLVVSAILIAAVVIQVSTAAFLPLMPFYLVILVAYGLSLIYLLLFLWDSHSRFQAAAQLLCDVLLITALVYISGGIGGQMYFLYVFAIIAAGFALGGRVAYVFAGLSAVVFGILADGMFYELIPYFRADQYRETSAGRVLYTIFLAWALFFVIGLLVARTASNLRRARLALFDAQHEIEIQERQAAAGRASAIVAHEIRNPLAAISGAVQVLRGELTLTGEQDKLMDMVVTESRRVSRSIEQFLSMAAPSRQTFATFRLSEVLAETLTMLQMSGELDGRVEVQGNYATAPHEYFGSPGQFKQVFWNLVRNALKAMPEGGVLSLDIFQRRRDELQIRIADTGRGMTPAEQARIFEPFYTRFEGGRGLGLAVVRQIIDRYAGKIDITSEPRVGTEISITLPVRPSAKAEGEEKAQGAG
jgi:two-component system sensor histidine kinase PilS (NtrC family)